MQGSSTGFPVGNEQISPGSVFFPIAPGFPYDFSKGEVPVVVHREDKGAHFLHIRLPIGQILLGAISLQDFPDVDIVSSARGELLEKPTFQV